MTDKPVGNESLAEKCGRMAQLYDKDKETHRWNGPHVLFGLLFDYINPGATILDIGIGTGLGSMPFFKAGLKVYGMDISPEMLSVCENKRIAAELKVHDLTKTPYPYADSSINHAICVGVLNHFETLDPVFIETSRILKAQGVFGFIVGDRKKDEEAMFEIQHAGSCHTMYRHGTDQINSLLLVHGFCLLRELEFIMPVHENDGKPNSLKAYVAGKGFISNV